MGRASLRSENADTSESSRTTSTSSTSDRTSSAAPAARPVIASSSGSPDIVDPAEATQVAVDLWAGITTAIEHGDTAALRAYEDGVLLEADIGAICKVGCPPQQFSPLQHAAVNVPHQTQYPAHFLASITYQSGCHAETSPCVNQFVAVQQAAGAPWKAVLRLQYGGDTYSQYAQLLPDGYAVAPADPAAARIHDLLADFANYDDAMKRTGEKPARTVLADGPFTSDNTRIYDSDGAQARRGLRATTTYTVDPADPVFVFATSDGGTTSCGNIRYTGSVVSATGAPLDASVAVHEFRLRVEPGRYTKLSVRGVHMVCFERLPSDAQYTVVASFGDNVAAAGERVAATN